MKEGERGRGREGGERGGGRNGERDSLLIVRIVYSVVRRLSVVLRQKLKRLILHFVSRN